MLLEIFKLRRYINTLNLKPEIAYEFFNQNQAKLITCYRIIKHLCKIKWSGMNNMFKEIPIIESDDAFIRYFVSPDIKLWSKPFLVDSQMSITLVILSNH